MPTVAQRTLATGGRARTADGSLGGAEHAD
jgi:hypothetical protein